ncbi:MAG: tryptophan/tyrosine permease [Gammaproteobacteria bacterium]|nr:tryptophan/tyrosine permease [Gammaproteobacteria bacterium]
MDSKLIGGILLIVGTSIGAGMLGLPIAAAELGFVGSLIFLLVCWLIMVVGALYLLEVNLWLPINSNLISMAKATIGPLGQGLAWLTYLLLLYSLLCAYIAGGSDLFHNVLEASGLDLPLWVSSISFTLLFGFIVYGGIRVVDFVNRGLMFVKFGAYIILVLLLFPFISVDKLTAGNLTYLSSATVLTVTITAFGYGTIIPSLRVYFMGDARKLKIAIIIGSLIPLVCYIIWDAVIMGVIPLNGENSLINILNSPQSVSDLVNTLSKLIGKEFIIFFIKLFTSICVVTSFLGVSLCLTDFFSDGLQLEKKGYNNIIIHAVTFLPSLIIALYFPNVFIKALKYAGINCIILLVLLPAWMAWNGRYRRGIAEGFRVGGGKIFLISFIVLALILILRSVSGS